MLENLINRDIVLEIRNLTLKYIKTNKIVFEDITFSVQKSEIIAILGPSGSGKTTLLNAISGLIEEKDIIKTGSIKINSKKGPSDIRTVFQKPRLLPWKTVHKNIAFGLEIKKISKEEIKKNVTNIIKIVGLNGCDKYYPHQLSVGMQQRVNFARALICNPKILFLDEPFSALDIKTKKKIQKEFLEIIKEKKIASILVTHNIEEALFMANKIIIFHQHPTRVKTIIDNKNSNLNAQDIIDHFDNDKN